VTTSLALTDRDRAMAEGEGTPAQQLAMRILIPVAEALGASRLLDITAAHIDSCLFHGIAGLDFAERLVAGGGRVAVPTTLNVTSLDLLHPGLRGDTEHAAEAARLVAAYEALGGRPTWTCAPYQLEARPGLGDQVAWGESNAIVFANSVLGARTERYGDFTDICAAITGRAPAAGLHLDRGRLGGIVFELRDLPDEVLASDVLFPVLGHLIGYRAGQRIPVIVGLEGATEDQLKALGAGAASSGAVAMFHAVGITPEAPTLAAATGGRRGLPHVTVGMEELMTARDDLSTVPEGTLSAVAFGTPHASAAELDELQRLFGGHRVAEGVACSVNTSRDVLAGFEGTAELAACGVDVVVDTCTYLKPIMDIPVGALVMTDSAKWAYYAPANIGAEVVFGSTEDCVLSAIAGEVTRAPGWWRGA
jgi:predicted aconitase